MKLVTIVGARPQFIKAALLSEALRASPGVVEILVHTGQHYDARMSDVFFQQLSMRAPDYCLEVGSGTHGRQSGAMLASLDDVLERERPDVVLIYGDTNSTLAGALAAVKMHIPVAHVEAGLRSYNRRMPEEVNRVVADVVSSLLLCPTATAVENLKREGISDGVHLVGDVMLDMLLRALPTARETDALRASGVTRGEYYLATIHRAENTDDPVKLRSLVDALDTLDATVLLPLHPRTRHALDRLGWAPRTAGSVRPIEPVGYLEMVALEDAARAVLTDSGGVQKEAFFLRRPCITLRDETEWTETLAGGWNQLVGGDGRGLRQALDRLPDTPADLSQFGDGRAADRMAALLTSM